MKINYHKEAIKMRKNGWSYTDITQKLNIAKSTLSGWLSNIPYKPNGAVIKRIKNGPAISAAKSKQAKIERVKTAFVLAKKELGEINKRDLWMLGIGLYLGEGSKKFEEVRVANSDPKIIKLAVRWLTEACGVPKKHIRMRLFAYPDTDITKAKNFWKKITELPVKSFAKNQIDNRKNKKRQKWSSLPYGTLHLLVRSMGKKEYGKALHHRIMGWINSVLSAGVV